MSDGKVCCGTCRVVSNVTAALVAILAFAIPVTAAKASASGFPKLFAQAIGNGENYLDPAYLNSLSKMDAVLLALNTWNAWKAPHTESPGAILAALHARNPALLVGQYTVLDEAYNDGVQWHAPDEQQKLAAQNWWLRDASGHMQTRDSTRAAWDTNFTDWTKPDAQGYRFPEWYNRRNDAFFFKTPGFAIWYFDVVFSEPRDRVADWHQDGVDLPNSSSEVQTAYRNANAEEWKDARRLEPGLLMIGNATDGLTYPEYAGQLDGAVLEAIMGISWSTETKSGWQAAMDRYREAMRDTRPPHLVDFDVRGATDDYRLMRYGLASCLMDNGYFSYSDKNNLYHVPPLFDEYNVSLGAAIDPPQTEPWQNGVYRRRFQHGMALVNPSPFLPATVDVGTGYVHINGHQDPSVNSGRPASEVFIPPKDGVILLTASTR